VPKSVLHALVRNEIIDDEIWKDVRGFENLYQVSDFGRVRRILKLGRTRIMIPCVATNDQRLCVTMRKDGKGIWRLIGHLVANAFVINDKGGSIVHYVNWNYRDNRAKNLEWITKATLTKKLHANPRGIPIQKIDIETNEIVDEYRSIAEAAKANGLGQKGISWCMKGAKESSGGFKWVMDKEEYEAKDTSRLFIKH